jgi:hypothetical protein
MVRREYVTTLPDGAVTSTRIMLTEPIDGEGHGAMPKPESGSNRRFGGTLIRHSTNQMAAAGPPQFDTQPQVPASQLDARVFGNRGGFNQVKT